MSYTLNQLVSLNVKVNEVLSTSTNITKLHDISEKNLQLHDSFRDIELIVNAAASSSTNLNNILKALSKETEEAKGTLQAAQQTLYQLDARTTKLVQSLGDALGQIEWAKSALQISWAAESIQTKYNLLMRICCQKAITSLPRVDVSEVYGQSRKTIKSTTDNKLEPVAKRLTQDIVSSNRGVAPALDILYRVLVGKVTADPQQPALLQQFVERINSTSKTKEEKRSIIKGYVTSMIMLQIKGLTLLLNALQVVGDMEESTRWTDVMHTRFIEMVKMVGGEAQYSLWCLVAKRVYYLAAKDATPVSLHLKAPPTVCGIDGTPLPDYTWGMVSEDPVIAIQLTVFGKVHSFARVDENLNWIGDGGEMIVVPLKSSSEDMPLAMLNDLYAFSNRPKPAAPYNIRVEVGGTSLTFKWEVVSADPPVSSYVLKFDDEYRVVDLNVYTFDGLPFNSKHTFQIAARNSNGQSNFTQMEATTGALPSAPIQVTLVSRNNYVASFRWKQPDSDPIKFYYLQTSTGNNNWTTLVCPNPTREVDGMDPRIKHTVRVIANNKYGISDPSSECTVDVIENFSDVAGVYNIVSVCENKALDSDTSSAPQFDSKYPRPYLAEDSGKLSQLWEIRYAQHQSYSINVFGANLALDGNINVPQMDKGYPAPFLGEASTPPPRNHQWTIHSVEPGVFVIINRANAKSLDGNVNAATQKSAAFPAVFLWKFKSTFHQRWRFQKPGFTNDITISEGVYIIGNKTSQRVLDSNTGAVPQYANLPRPFMYQLVGSVFQLWEIRRIDDTWFNIVAYEGKKFLDGNTQTRGKDNRPISPFLWPSSGGEHNHHWRFQHAGPRIYNIINRSNSQVLDDNGTAMFVGFVAPSTAQTQQWTLQRDFTKSVTGK